MSRIGFIGTGHIAAPMVRHLAGKGHDVTVTHRSRAVSSQLAETIGVDVADPQTVVDKSEIVFLCLRPHQIDALTPVSFREGQQIVSAMAGVSTSQLSKLCAPARDFVQFIPLGYLETGGCPLAAFGNTSALSELFSPENPVVPVSSEAALNAHFAICAMVPGILDLLATGSEWLAEQTGDPDKAEFFSSQLTAGFLDAMEKGSSGRLSQERDALATEGTLSLQMVDALRSGGAHDALRDALTAIGKRLAPETRS